MVRPQTAPDYRLSTQANDPRYDTRWKMPGYTGHITSVYETFGTSPVPSQRKATFRNASEMDPLHRSAAHEPNRDPCNNPNTWFKPTPELLWPQVAGQHPRKQNINNKSSIVFGDRRIAHSRTHYEDAHMGPAKAVSVWEPEVVIKKHKYDLASMSPDERLELYATMGKKIGEVQLSHIIQNLKLRFAAKLNTANNNNGFRLLKLFQNYDVDCNGTLELEEFVNALGSCGVQLPEEAEVVLFGRFDESNDGRLDYTEFISTLVDPEYLCLGFSAVDKKHKDFEDHMAALQHSITSRFAQLLTTGTGKMLKDQFRKIDANKDGTLTRTEFDAALKDKNINISRLELDFIFNHHDTSKDGKLDYAEFARMFLPDDHVGPLGKSRMTSQMNQRFFTAKPFQ